MVTVWTMVDAQGEVLVKDWSGSTFSDADFVDWRRSQVYSVNSDGILAIKPKPTEHDGGLKGLQP